VVSALALIGKSFRHQFSLAQYTGTPAYGQKLSDGGGLFIWISKHGKYWRLAYRYDKK
jgi:hypothetical protein